MIEGFLLGFVGGFLLGAALVYKSKSYQHRKSLVNLYIAGKVRKMAEKDGIDLMKENDDLKIWDKKIRRRTLNLDDTIEEEIQESVEESMNKKK